MQTAWRWLPSAVLFWSVGVMAAILPLQPRWSDFTIDGKPLFEECQTYLKSAGDLYAKARDICQQVHGNESLSTPPGYSF
jgi:hypothetical protein